MAHAHPEEDWLDPDLRDSIRTLRHQRSWRLIGVVVALVAAIVTAALYAFLSYNDRYDSSTSAEPL